MADTAERRVEVASILTAESYAAANGMPGDKGAAGLVLVGMAIMAAASAEVRAAFLTGYAAHFPADERTWRGWARYLHDATIDRPEADRA